MTIANTKYNIDLRIYTMELISLKKFVKITS